MDLSIIVPVYNVEKYIRPLLEKALETKVDLVVSDFLSMQDDDIKQFKGIIQQAPDFKEKSGEQLFLEDLNPYQCYVWRTLFRRDLQKGSADS
jgi:hypothetical protein